eukprot:m.54117 g.54117  ORF g.54117 m.54117 type:complete len:201 (+) comp15477_c0_seq4:140-742(+)
MAEFLLHGSCTVMCDLQYVAQRSHLSCTNFGDISFLVIQALYFIAFCFIAKTQAYFSGIAGMFAILVPHLAGVFFGEHLHHSIRYNPAGDPEVKVAHIILRFYGALLIGQAYIVWHARAITDGKVRRTFVQAYAIVFAISLVVLLRAHFTETHFELQNLTWERFLLNWGLIFFFALLTAGYAWFSIVMPPVVFSGLGHDA